MEKKNWLMNMLSEGSEVSVKRVIIFAAFVLLAIAFLLNLFFAIKISESLLNIMESIVFAGFGATTVEKFAKKTTPAIVVNDNSMTQNAAVKAEDKDPVI